jgi:hypothetical protein
MGNGDGAASGPLARALKLIGLERRGVIVGVDADTLGRQRVRL